MPMFDFDCEVCGAHRRVWRRADEPPKYCSRDCTSRGRTGRTTRPVKHPITPEMGWKIHKVYRTATGNGEVRQLAAELGRPYWKVVRYAAEQGWVAKTHKEPDWTPAELRLLEASAHRSPERIKQTLKKVGFRRSVTGIILKRQRMRLLQNLGGQSAAGLADCFGVNPSTILIWIDRGWLKAMRRGTQRLPQQGGDIWFIRDRAVRQFILSYPEVVDLRKVDKFWFIDLLAGTPAGQATWGPAGDSETEGIKGEIEAGAY